VGKLDISSSVGMNSIDNLAIDPLLSIIAQEGCIEVMSFLNVSAVNGRLLDRSGIIIIIIIILIIIV
jgi:hypothetical protein